MSSQTHYPVMAVAVASQRLAFVIIDENKLILDYGIWDFRYWDKRLLWPGLKRLTRQYQPLVVCLQDTNDPEYRLGDTCTNVIKHVHQNLQRNGIATKAVSKTEVRRALGKETKVTKEELANLLAIKFDGVVHLAPRPRDEWRSEHRNMCLFVALGLTTTQILQRR